MNRINKVAHSSSVEPLRQEKYKLSIINEFLAGHINFNSSGETLSLIPELIKPIQSPAAETMHALQKLSRR